MKTFLRWTGITLFSATFAFATPDNGTLPGDAFANPLIRSAERTVLHDDIVHYRFEVRVGLGAFDVIRLHRVVREQHPYRPVRTVDNIFMLTGAPNTFEMIFMEPLISSVPRWDQSIAIYLAKNNIDVWGMDYAWALVPPETTDFTFAIHDFFVGENGSELFAPPDGLFADVGQAFGIAIGMAAGFEFSIAGRADLPVGLDARQRVPTGTKFRRIFQRFNRLSLVRFRIKPRVVKLEENPLGPFEIIRVGGGEFTRPVVTEAERLNLSLERGDVLLGSRARVLAGFDGVLFGGQTKGVPAHRMQHIKTDGAFVAGENVRGGITFGMPDVQSGAAGVGKHVEDVKFRWQLGGRWIARKCMSPGKRMVLGDFLTRVKSAESLLYLPDFLPFGFNQMEWILPAAARHKVGILRKAGSSGNRGIGGKPLTGQLKERKRSCNKRSSVIAQ